MRISSKPKAPRRRHDRLFDVVNDDGEPVRWETVGDGRYSVVDNCLWCGHYGKVTPEGSLRGVRREVAPVTRRKVERSEPAPPQNLDAEETLLGAMMISTKAIVDVSEVLDPSGADFYREGHGTIYRAALALYARNEPVDAITLADELDQRSELEDVGGSERIHELAAIVPAPGNAGHHASIVRECAALRSLIRAGGEIARLGWERPGELPDLLTKTESIVSDLRRHRKGASSSLEAVSASRIAREFVKWLWRERIPIGMLTMLVGNPGLGKSLLTCLIAAWLSRGELGEPGVTLMISAEDSFAHVVRPRLEAAQANLDLVHCVRARREGLEDGVRIPDDLDGLEQLIETHAARLVVIDPISAHLPERINSWNDQSVRRALAPLHQLAERHECAVLVVGHLNKGGSGEALHRIGGSIGFGGAARSVLLLDRDPDDPDGEAGTRRVLISIKSNVGAYADTLAFEVEPIVIPALADAPEVETARLRHTGTSDVRSAGVLYPMRHDRPSERQNEAGIFLREILAAGPLPQTEIQKLASDAGIAEKTLRRAKSSLGVTSTRVKLSGAWAWTWALPQPGHEGTPEHHGRLDHHGHLHSLDGLDGHDGQEGLDGQDGHAVQEPEAA